MREELYFFWLSLCYIAKNRYDSLIKVYGDLPTVFESIKKGKFIKIDGFGKKLFSRLQINADEELLKDKFSKMTEKDIKFTWYTSEKYPQKLKNIYSSPIALFYRGSLPSNEIAIGVVGSRAPSDKGLYYARKISKELSNSGVAIISGMALGIDSAAHIGALKGSGKTYAILGCGVDICYPRNNIELYLEIVKRGGIISEFPPETEPLKVNFPLRNRIISGLSDGVFVVEAREKSGSLITADLGLEQGKTIYALPSRSDEIYALGTNKLIQSGAKLVNNVNDILEDFDFPELMAGNMFFSSNNLTLLNDDKLVYDTLSFEPKHVSEIIKETELEAGKLFNILLRLELQGYVKRTSFEYYITS